MKKIINQLVICFLFSLLFSSLASAQSFCGDIPIDDFSSPAMTLIDVTEDEPLVELVDDGGSAVIGRFRTITFELLEFIIGSDEARFLIEVDIFSVSNDVGVRSRANILYDADGAGLGLDLSSRELITLSVISLDNGISLTYVLTDENANQASLTQAVPGISDPVEVQFLFDDFVGIQSVDLSAIESVEFIVQSDATAADVSIQAISFGCQGTPPEFVPVPTMNRFGYVAMAMLLLLMGLLWVRHARAQA